MNRDFNTSVAASAAIPVLYYLATVWYDLNKSIFIMFKVRLSFIHIDMCENGIKSRCGSFLKYFQNNKMK